MEGVVFHFKLLITKILLFSVSVAIVVFELRMIKSKKLDRFGQLVSFITIALSINIELRLKLLTRGILVLKNSSVLL